MPEKEYLPFIAINVFMQRDYLEKVTKEIIEGIGTLSKEEQIAFNGFFRKHITILGFRNPLRAPLSLQVNAYASAFEKNEDVIPYTLSKWARIKSELAEKVKAWLDSEGWEELVVERTIEDHQGFASDWPDDLTFESIEEKFKEANPKEEFLRDDLVLMVLWISGKLPKE
ncbi:MAG: hypothetical protein ACNA70_00280 [Brevefilum sp.]